MILVERFERQICQIFRGFVNLVVEHGQLGLSLSTMVGGNTLTTITISPKRASAI